MRRGYATSPMPEELTIGKNFEFEHVADVELKGFPDPVPVSKVVS